MIVVDPSRWSRDNVKSEQGLRTLRDCGVRFFTGQTQHDLFDPSAILYLGMAANINQYVAAIGTQKSLKSKIARASRGLPASGRLPYGRTYNKLTEAWGIDEEKRKKVQWAARQYVKGEQLPKLARTLGMNASSLWKILNRRSGDMWEIEFQSKQHAIDEKVALKIPPLLDPITIRRIHARAEANKTCEHGPLKYQYLLKRTVFCARCGLAMFGQTNHNLTQYYRHSRDLQKRKCDPGLYVNANMIEEAVLVSLFATLGDPAGMAQAMSRAIPDRTKITELREKKRFLESELSKAQTQKQRIVKSIAGGTISDDEAKSEMAALRERESSLREEIDTIGPQLADVPGEEEIKRRAKMIQRMVGQVYRTPSRLKKMSFEERRKLVSSFFSGKDAKGRRLGVYVEKIKVGTVHFEIHGAFDQTFKGTLATDGPDILDYRDVSVEHLEELKEAARGPKSSSQVDLSCREKETSKTSY